MIWYDMIWYDIIYIYYIVIYNQNNIGYTLYRVKSPWVRGFKELHFSRHTYIVHLKKKKSNRKILVSHLHPSWSAPRGDAVPWHLHPQMPSDVFATSSVPGSNDPLGSSDSHWISHETVPADFLHPLIPIWTFHWISHMKRRGKSSANPGKSRNGILQIRHGFQFTQKKHVTG